jgi:plastocyanin
MIFKRPGSFNYGIIYSGIAVIASMICMTAATTTTTIPYSSIASVSIAMAQEMIKVQAGGGNATAPLTQFIPQKVEIKTGQSIMWVNPTTVGEPHTVTLYWITKQ